MNRNNLKANTLDATADILLITAIAIAFGTDSFLRPLLADTFGPIADRLRGLEPEGTER